MAKQIDKHIKMNAQKYSLIIKLAGEYRGFTSVADEALDDWIKKHKK